MPGSDETDLTPIMYHETIFYANCEKELTLYISSGAKLNHFGNSRSHGWHGFCPLIFAPLLGVRAEQPARSNEKQTALFFIRFASAKCPLLNEVKQGIGKQIAHGAILVFQKN